MPVGGAADFTATNGTSVVLANACTAGDYVRFEGFLITSFNDAVPNTNGAVGDSLIASLSASKLTGSQTLPSGVLPTGSVVQVVNATYSLQASSSSATYADTGLTATITPKFASSKILVLVDAVDCANGFSNGALLGLALVRNSTLLVQFSGYGGFYNLATAVIDFGSCSTNYLDSPSTTSATTYKVQIKNFNAGGVMYMNYTGSSTSTITLMEIAG